ncbi:MAG: hypothetical protein AAB152_03915 [Candidatus Coatesbacteria bacterium]
MSRFRVLLPAALLGAAAILPAEIPAAPVPLDALMDATGSIRVTDGSREICTIQPGTALAGWQGLPAKGPEPLAGGRTGRRYRLDGGGEVTIEATGVRKGNVFTITYRLATTATLAMESVHASVNFPVEPWVGAAFAVGKLKGRVPATASEVRLSEAVATQVALGPSAMLGGLTFTVATNRRLPLLVQDSRKWWPNLELRIIDPHEGAAPWTWGPGHPVTFRFTASANRPIRFAVDAPVTIKAGKEWIPLREGLEVEPGSALDFSGMGLTRTPAGALGRLRASAGSPGTLEFEGEPGRPVRMYGNNLGLSACSPTHEEAERLADRFRRRGYSIIRIHHYEMPPWDPRNGLMDPEAPDSLTFNPEHLEKFDYLVAALKRRGIYVSTDLYVSRAVRSSEIFPGTAGRLTDRGYQFKQLVCVSDAAMANWKAFAKLLLTHVNPYTGLAYRDDPALAFLVLVNEGNLPNEDVEGLRRDPRWAPLWESAWATWKTARGVTGEWGGPEFHRFLWEMHRRAEAEQIRYLKTELGVKAMVSDLNGWTDEWGTQLCRTAFDWVDNHSYWDHPAWVEKEWELPSRGSSGGGSATAAGWLAGVAPLTRLLDRPFSISEYNFCPPNSYRGEGGLLFGAGAALQGWGVVWRFSYAGSAKGSFEPGPVSYFDTVDDPLSQAAEFAAVALFVRGDLEPAVHAVALTGTAERLGALAGERLPGDLARLAWVVRVGSLVGTPAEVPGLTVVPVEPQMDGPAVVARIVRRLRADGVLSRGNATDPARGIWESADGRVKLEAGLPVMTVVTPRTEGIAGPAGTARKLGSLAVDLRDTWTTLWASSLDGRPLGTSRRILVAHLTDVKNSGMRFRGRDLRILEAWGTKPYLARAGRATVTLVHDAPASLRVWRLNLTGRRLAPVRAKASKKTLVFDAVTATKPEATLFYEIAAMP